MWSFVSALFIYNVSQFTPVVVCQELIPVYDCAVSHWGNEVLSWVPIYVLMDTSVVSCKQILLFLIQR